MPHNTLSEAESITTTEALDHQFAHFPLNERSFLWVIGGCNGLQVRHFLDHYKCAVDVFEPQLVFVDLLLRKYAAERVTVHPYGLGESSGLQQFWNGGTDGGTFVDVGGPVAPTKFFVRDFYAELREWGRVVDLCLMNCEGSEINLIRRMMWMKDFDYEELLKRLPRLLIQFHPQFVGQLACQAACKDLQTLGYRCLWHHNISWTYWEKR